MPVKMAEEPGGVRFRVKVVPGASRDRIVGALGDALKLAVSKPPQGGAANSAVIALLARELGIASRQVSIVRGHASPQKEVFLAGVSAAEVRSKLPGGI